MLRSLAPALVSGLLLVACGSPSAPDAPTTSSPVVVPAPSGPSEASTLPPAPTTPVPAPTPGSTAETVPARPAATRSPVKVDATASPTQDVTVRVTRLAAIQAEAQGPGEVAGPALAVRVEIRNGGDSRLDLTDALVSLTASDGSPGQVMSASPTSPFPASVAAGRAASGTYVFTVAKDQRDPVRIDVTVDADLAVVAFQGEAPR